MEKYFKRDDEVKELKTREALGGYLDFREKNDVWVEPYVDECALVGLENNPMAILDLKGRKEFDVESSMEDLESCQNDMGWLLNFPMGDKYVVYPVLYTGIDSVCQRAGISGRSIRNTEKKKNVKVMSPVRKAAVITEMFGLYTAKCKILIRDGKIPYMGSAVYLPLSAKKGIETLEAELTEEHPKMRFRGGQVSHEYLLAEYDLNDPEMMESIKDTLESAGKAVSVLNAGVRFVTSDAGSSMMRVSAFISVDGVKATIGKPIGIRHDISKMDKDKKKSDYEYVATIGGDGTELPETEAAQEAGMARFADEVKRIGSVFKECEDQVEELGNTIINNPAGCFQHIVLADKSLPMGIAKEVADELDQSYRGCASAIDIFFALNDMVERANAKKPMSPTQYISLTEAVAETLFIDYTAYDQPLTEWKR